MQSRKGIIKPGVWGSIGDAKRINPCMENEEILQKLCLQALRGFLFWRLAPVGILQKQQMKSEIKDLDVMKRKSQKGRWETDQAIISQGNLAPFAQDLATKRPQVRSGRDKASKFPALGSSRIVADGSSKSWSQGWRWSGWNLPCCQYQGGDKDQSFKYILIWAYLLYDPTSPTPLNHRGKMKI